jgi:hypothetical protein
VTESHQSSRADPLEAGPILVEDPSNASIIVGPHVLRGLMLYGATLAFVAMYVSFVVRISTSAPGRPPALNSALVSAAAALAGSLAQRSRSTAVASGGESETTPRRIQSLGMRWTARRP